MLREICPGVFGALLLICLCHSARLNATDEGEKSSNSSSGGNNGTQVRKDCGRGRCLGWFKNWATGGDIVSGNPDDVRFYLYPNLSDLNYSEEITFEDVGNLKRVHFRAGQPWKFIIHGFTKDHVSESVQYIKNAYLTRMSQGGVGLNIVMVDWSPLGNPKVGDNLSGLFYRLAVRNIPVVAERVAEMVQFLMRYDALRSLDDVHIVGFSLGAHVAGNSGHSLKKLTGQVPARVTGLDPAGPAFYEQLAFSHRRLQNTDGSFVDVIHSNKGAMGIAEDIGHVDFYPNGGGPMQPQCEEEYNRKRLEPENKQRGLWDTKLLSVSSCSHNKAPEFFAISILNPAMVACKCRDFDSFKSGCQCLETAIFGEYCDPRTRGRFYLNI